MELELNLKSLRKSGKKFISICLTMMLVLGSMLVPMTASAKGDFIVAPNNSVTDGKTTDGNVTDGNVTDGNVTDGNVTDGNVSDGNVTDGNVTDGNVISGKCGSNLVWKLYMEIGLLKITGIGSMRYYYYAPWYSYRTYIKRVVIGDGVTSILSRAFYNYDNLTSVTIPDSVKIIGAYAFYDCDSLKTVTSGNVSGGNVSGGNVSDGNVGASIGNYAFASCNGLVRITIPYFVTSIGDYAFYNCTGLTRISISDSVTHIGERAFYNTGYYNNSKNWTTSKESFLMNFCYIINRVLYIGKHLIQAQNPYIQNNSSSGAINNFINSYLEKIGIPYVIKKGTKCIADNAFYNCTKLTSITLPDSVTSIGICAFYGCTKLTSIKIGKGVTSIGTNAFYNTAYYKNSNNWTDEVLYIGDYLVNAKTSISGGYTVKDGTKVIAGGAFNNCDNLTNVTIPDSVINIGEGAFYSCGTFDSIVIPDSVKSIGENAFDYCSNLENVYITDIAAWCNIAFENFLSNPMIYAENLYLNDDFVRDIVIPDSVKSIGDYVFYDCDRLVNVRIPDSVISIGDYAFYDCTKLVNVTISDSVTSIGEYAFYNCYSLKSINIGNGVTSIGGYAFAVNDRYYFDDWYNNEGLTSVTIGHSVTSIGDCAFYNRNNLLENVYITDVSAWCNISFGNYYSNPINYAENLYLNNELVKDLAIPDSVKVVGAYAFYNCNCLENITISDSVETIGAYAFYGCRYLNDITIPDSVTKIGKEAFFDTAYYYNSSNWTGGVLYIDNHLIKADSSFYYGEYEIRNNTKSVASYAFEYCDGLTSIKLPNSLVGIGYRSFYDCDALKEVVIAGPVISIGEYAFGSCSGLKALRLPCTISKIQMYAFYSCNVLKNVYYDGSEADWAKVKIRFFNDALNNADKHYNSHIYSDVIMKKPTCTETGAKSFICLCGDTSHTEIIPAHGHDYQLDGSIVPSCTSGGYGIHLCVYCNKYQIKAIPAKGHSYEIVTTIEPTCTTEGTGIKKCSDCGAEGEEETIPALGHEYLCVKKLDATCTEDGYETFRCLSCYDMHTNTIPALGHNYQRAGTVDATCTEEGYEIFKCENCKGYQLNIIPVLTEHVYELVTIVEPTCTEAGTGINKCKYCGVEGEEEIIPTLGHDYRPSVMIGSTCTSEGHVVCCCQRCDDSIVEPLPLADHRYKDGLCVDCGAKAENTLPVIDACEGATTVIDSEKKVISGLSENLNAESIMDYIAVSDEVTVSFSNEVIGTGTMITLTDNSGKVLDTYTIVIYGDYNGDGVADAEDTGYFASISNFEIFDYYECEYLFMAADINGDGLVDSMDEEDMNAIANFEAYIDHTITEGSKVVRY